MRILRNLSEVEKEDFTCEVVDCGNRADLYVTDDTEEGEGFICRKCNDEDEMACRVGWE